MTCLMLFGGSWVQILSGTLRIFLFPTGMLVTWWLSQFSDSFTEVNTKINRSSPKNSYSYSYFSEGEKRRLEMRLRFAGYSEPVFGQLARKSQNMKWQHWGHIFLLIECKWDTLMSVFLYMPISQHLDLTEIYFDLSFLLSFFFCLSYYTQLHCPHYCLSFP